MQFVYQGEKAGEVNEALSGLAGCFARTLGANLKGLYLHGSLAMGCFRPWSSDVDLLAVVFAPMDREAKLKLVGDVMELAEGGDVFRKFEFSVVTADEALRAKHPIRYILHYSDSWHEAYKQGNAELVTTGGEDEDLAAHFTVVRHRGVALLGAPIAETFGQVPREDYLRAVWYDIRDAENEALKNPAYAVLNLCRTLMYLETGAVPSKREGGLWAAGQPGLARWKPVIAAALAQYAGEGGAGPDRAACGAFARHMLERIQPPI